MLKKNIVFIISLLITFSLVLFGALAPQSLEYVSTVIHQNIIQHFGWGYLLFTFIFLLFSIILAFSKYGQIKLGKDYEKPQYSYFGWFSMLFAAGMGIGLIFWGVAEPLNHYMNPPVQIASHSGESAAFAMRYSFFHWGLQPWAIYIVMSLAIAYFSFRRNMPPLISSCFYPLIGEAIYGPVGKLIDILAVIATVFGVATSLGLGALQITSGLSMVFSVPDQFQTTFIVIIVVTVLYMISSVSGLDKGIQLLSKSNILLAIILLLFMFIVGPTSYILNIFTSTVGDYLSNIVSMSLNSNPFEGYEWTKSWTMFYWAWWIAWSPFVGLFVARISRGRTIREFIIGALLVPAAMTFLWFSVFGGAGFYLELHQNGQIAQMAVADVTKVLFYLFEAYPFSPVLSGVAIILLIVFFVTSADSATYVLSMMTSNGDINPPVYKKLLWGIIQSSAAVILIMSGGLKALQKMAIAAALPFTFVMLFLTLSILKALRLEYKKKQKIKKRQLAVYHQRQINSDHE